MLRSVRILLVGWEIVLVATSVALLAIGAAWGPLLLAYAIANAVIVVAALRLERSRYDGTARGRRDGAGPGSAGFQRTDEIFIDPTTRTRMRVWVDRESGERSYRAEPDRER